MNGIKNKLKDILSTKSNIHNVFYDKTGQDLSSNLNEWPRKIYEISGYIPTVDFYDYDGTLLYSYQCFDFVDLTEMPPLPTQPGLICQGWNWDLDHAKEYVNEYGSLDIGAMYITDDGKTRLYIDLGERGDLIPIYFTQSMSNGVTINWGDGTPEETLTGVGDVYTNHVYKLGGKYTITLEPNINCEFGLGSNIEMKKINGTVIYTPILHEIGNIFLQKIELGINVYFNTHCLWRSNAKCISIPKQCNKYFYSSFSSCKKLKCIIFPKIDDYTNVKSWGISDNDELLHISYPQNMSKAVAVSGCNIIKRITIPDGVTYVYVQTCVNISRIVLPNSVSSINLSGCSSLQYLRLSKSLSNINLSGCSSLSYLDIPDGVVEIGRFSNCISIKNINIPDSCKFSDERIFDGCGSLQIIKIPNNIRTIPRYTFQGCTSLQSITIPDSVTWIGDYAFNGCTTLGEVIIPDGVTSIGEMAFMSCASLQNVVIGNSVTSIGNYAFNHCYNLQNITIPDSVTSIGGNAFQYCTSLQNITIPDSVKTISGSAFYNCTSLQSITIPDSVTKIGSMAFYNCTSLQSITIPDSVTKIDSMAFCDCTSLQSITIPDSVTEIGSSAFQYCTSLQNITIPDSVKTISGSAFYNCTSLQSITIPDGVTSIGGRAFQKCYSLQSITIPDSVTKIDSMAFCDCTSLQSITIPDSVTEIGSSAFQYCTSLQNITIPDSVTSIDYGTFKDCTSLQNAVIGNSVSTIGNSAFSGCNSLQYIDCTSCTSIPTLGTDVFKNIPSDFEIRVPSVLYNDWCNATNWSKYKDNIKHGLMGETDFIYNSLSITADDVSGRKTSTTIYYTANVTGTNLWTGEPEIGDIAGIATSDSFPQNTSTTDTVERIITFELGGLTATTTITQGVWIEKEYVINLNDQWQLSSKPNPDSSLYDGVYESFSNYKVNNGYATMYIDIVGYDTFKLYIRSYAESSYDYIMVSQLDKDITGSTSYSDTALVKAHTGGNQQSGTALSNYKLVEFTGIDGDEHRITVVYRKDSSTHSGDDKGYVFIVK